MFDFEAQRRREEELRDAVPSKDAVFKETQRLRQKAYQDRLKTAGKTFVNMDDPQYRKANSQSDDSDDSSCSLETEEGVRQCLLERGFTESYINGYLANADPDEPRSVRDLLSLDPDKIDMTIFDDYRVSAHQLHRSFNRPIDHY